MGNRIFSVEFLSELVRYYNAVKDKLTPLGDFETARGTVLNNLALRKGTDAVLYDACDEDTFRTLYVSTRTIKEVLVPTAWDHRNAQDWMYIFSKQIWAINARRDEFGPVKFKDETEEEWRRRRALGAKNVLAQLDAGEIPLVSSSQEFMQSMADLSKDNAAQALGILFVVGRESSTAAACPMLLQRASTIASGQISRLNKISRILDDLYRRLSAIANEQIPVTPSPGNTALGVPGT
jgi:hypothetical protein